MQREVRAVVRDVPQQAAGKKEGGEHARRETQALESAFVAGKEQRERFERRLGDKKKRRAEKKDHGRRRRRREGEPEGVRGGFVVAPVREEVDLRAQTPGRDVMEHEPVETVLHRAPRDVPGAKRDEREG